MLRMLINSVLIVSLFSGCSSTGKPDGSSQPEQTTLPAKSPQTIASASQMTGKIDYQQEMRNFVQRISAYAKNLDKKFIIIPQNGEELVAGNPLASHDYLKAIDGIGREDFIYGYNRDNVATPATDRNDILSYLNIFKANCKTVLVTDYCSSVNKIQNSYETNAQYGFIAFTADQRELNNIPAFPKPLFHENAESISSLAEVKNFLYLINPEEFSSKNHLIEALHATNYDLLIIDAFYNESPLTQSDLARIKVKQNGGQRLVISYISIGEAEAYRYYWQNDWLKTPPDWLEKENPEWDGNYQVKYWDMGWQNIIYGNDQSYCRMIINAGFDGIYLDIIDAYEYFCK